ncbi:HD-GYP domain-containing protein (c-di-GMP phosphodiesterase class II) [Fontibacillus phaseoli]|uniref:HD-GYP domain-containing protein (C-di-GMP phosphodiesterase class II) n=1 Tax=Fontibacillus phaseoli TaxID=1416533 RepID=A0A369B7R9_9BACL|nr:HD-GYP domain-containing protein [Fontibacillus phaseoli]RCX17355.1 HD-GYP domain-containing protein (c-di-GMP phosphodiesterase class II) [Fontibacillus phaseoli]
MKIHIMDLSPGDRLESDIFNHFGVLVLQKEKELTNDAIVKLMQHGIDYVDVVPYTPDVQIPVAPPISEQVQKLKPYFDNAVDGFESIFLEALTRGTFDENQVDELLEPMVNQLVNQKDVVSLLLLLSDSDNYTYNHSMQVGMLSYYIASWLGYPTEEAYTAGKAGYLIDIGKCMVPQDILHKPGKLTPEEFEEIKHHTTYGHDIVLKSTGDKLSALVALQHHEREDGSGYPHGLTEKDIHPLAKIAAVADVYTAMTSNRVYQSKQELLSVLRELNSLSFGKLSPEPTQALINHLLPNFIGKRVLLSSGEVGSIVMTNQSDFFRPLVQTDSRFVDLSKERDTAIEEVYL